MRVLIACEFSGIVRDAFAARGHDAWSCDLLPSERPGQHVQRDVEQMLWDEEDGFDLMIAHPPCTHLAVSGARYFKEKRADGRQQAALEFVKMLMNAPIDKICVENPVSIISTQIRKPDQIIQPWQFGHPESKTTCLWLKNLSPLAPTKIVEPELALAPNGEVYRDNGGKTYSPTHYFSGRGMPNVAQTAMFEDARQAQRRRWANQTASRQNKLTPSPDIWKIRSRTYAGIAEAMAAQWGGK